MHLALKYSVFAAIATIANLAAQELIVQVYQDWGSLYFAIIVGTLVGLVSKYQLDKRYIFYYQTRSTQQDLSNFIDYGVTGVLTTLIFWGFELGFELVFASKFARYSGACIGLSIGYAIKYRLDKHFVFSLIDTDS